VGTTGSGKSFLAQQILKPFSNVIVIDAKGDFEYTSVYGKPRIIDNPHDLSRVKPDNPAPIYYRPKPDFWDSEVYDGVYKWIYTRKNCTVYTDEIFAVMGEAGKPPHWFNAILTRGRSLHIRSISCTQRPFRVPITTLSEAEHYFCFQLKLRDDVKRMAELMDETVMQPITVEHAFYYSNSTKPNIKARLCKIDV
jgi:hypothetical protein